MDDDIFRVPVELLSDSAQKRNLAKAMTNDDVVAVIHTLIERLNDMYMIVLAADGFDVETKRILLSPDNLNSHTTLRYLNLINNLTDALQKKLQVIEMNIKPKAVSSNS